MILNLEEEFLSYVNFFTGCTKTSLGEWPVSLNADKKKYQSIKAFSFYDSVRQIVFAEHDKFAQHIACYNVWSFKLKHKSNLSIISPNQNY